MDHQPIEPASPAEQKRLAGYAEQIKANPHVQEMLRQAFRQHKRTRLIGPGIDTTERAFYEGVDIGIKVALGMVALMEQLMAAPEEPEDDELGAG